MKNKTRFSWRALAFGVSLLPLTFVLPSADARAAQPAAAAGGEMPLSLRISPSQYKQIITDIFGPTITINGRFEPEQRDEGLLAIGARKASITDTGLERYDDMARGVANQILDVRHRDTFVHCKPSSPSAADDACAREFIADTGRLLLRRSMTQVEIDRQVKVAGDSANTLKDFYTGLSTSLAQMLISPDFLFRYKRTEADPANPGKTRLDGYSKASVLSFYLWNSAPDNMLLKAAEDGSIHTSQGLQRQVDRMVSSPRMEGGVRAFFSDMLGYSRFETVAKDPTFFPRYTLTAKEDSQEQTLRTIVDHVIVRQGDYRDLFTTRNTFLTRSLAALYNVPLPEKNENGQPLKWLPYTYPEGDQRAGLLAQASFVALFSPAGRSSPTDRGKAIREYVMCQAVPAPPGNVDFSEVESASSDLKTARERLTAHAKEAMCSGCHKITDPLGLALENFDSAGGWRTTENGAQIDTSGAIGRVNFTGPLGLGETLRNDPVTTSCVARRAFGYGAGRTPTRTDTAFADIEKKFQASNYKVLELFRQVALSDVLYTVPSTQSAAAGK